jgi:hypothetical protein
MWTVETARFARSRGILSFAFVARRATFRLEVVL